VTDYLVMERAWRISR